MSDNLDSGLIESILIDGSLYVTGFLVLVGLTYYVFENKAFHRFLTGIMIAAASFYMAYNNFTKFDDFGKLALLTSLFIAINFGLAYKLTTFSEKERVEVQDDIIGLTSSVFSFIFFRLFIAPLIIVAEYISAALRLEPLPYICFVFLIMLGTFGILFTLI